MESKISQSEQEQLTYLIAEYNDAAQMKQQVDRRFSIAEGGIESFKNYLARKYNLADGAVVNFQTGEITGQEVAQTEPDRTPLNGQVV